MLIPVTTEYVGFIVLAAAYGLGLGGYHYSIKIYLYDRVKSRDFSQVWSLLQACMALSVGLGVPLVHEAHEYLGQEKFGFLISGGCLFLAAFVLVVSSICSRTDSLHGKVRHRKTQTSHSMSGS